MHCVCYSRYVYGRNGRAQILKREEEKEGIKEERKKASEVISGKQEQEMREDGTDLQKET